MYQVTLEEGAIQPSELVCTHTPVALWLLINPADEVTSLKIAFVAQTSGAFDWLADEPDLYDITSGTDIGHIKTAQAVRPTLLVV